MIPKKITPETLLDLTVRRWYVLAGPFALAMMVAVGLAATLPRLYKSETTILVEPQEVPTSYVTPTVTYAVEDRLQAMSQQILSRTKLLEIAGEFGLYPELRKRPEEDLVERMRADIGVDLGGREKRGQQEVSYFKLSFSYPKPETAQRVTARLASLFIEENLKIRSEQAKLTTDFLEKELTDMEVKLKEKEQLVSRFKQGYMGALPEQLGANLNALTGLQTQLQTNQAGLSAAEERALLIQKAAADYAQAPSLAAPHGGLTARPDSPAARLAALKQALAGYEARYTPQHPNVIKTRKEIARLEADLAKAPEASGGEAPAAVPAGFDPGMRNQLITAKADIERLKQEQAATKRKIALYQARVEATPRREQDLASLTRDYEMMQANYQSLLKKRIDAKMAENLENKQQGEQFRMIDPPNLPARPFKPDLRKLFSFALMLGLGTGVGLCFLLEYLDRSFKDTEDLEEFLHLNVLATIPLVKTEEEVRHEKRRRLVLAGAGAAALVLYSGLVFYAYWSGLTLRLPLLS
jgi:polysaccharide chain length determinant protein (PEP-CTERM system associated)